MRDSFCKTGDRKAGMADPAAGMGTDSGIWQRKHPELHLPDLSPHRRSIAKGDRKTQT
ncbi:hypothetical protein HS960_25695 [Sphingobacterium paramultivorum]|uniref:Uncharacterized protein n=1 Tax=Sphingobacterium paramultivorum TaxID=2886510 RepID=A0A7G5EA06_9SPHI|nr:hypothetical protein [Sphingobacterium paramultivorum]QMV70831.1 hypothetical protein HS960_25695 [Sphingobacterium paramultivorum]WSO14709.1 hypothetical protein VUL84_25690 [Sphingobacterium paramultivorum]